jgi:hypothetical protein
MGHSVSKFILDWHIIKTSEYMIAPGRRQPLMNDYKEDAESNMEEYGCEQPFSMERKSTGEPEYQWTNEKPVQPERQVKNQNLPGCQRNMPFDSVDEMALNRANDTGKGEEEKSGDEYTPVFL